MYAGGFVKAYRTLTRRDANYAINPNDHIQDIKEHLELVYNEMCDAWYDYTRSDEFDDTHADEFDDGADWLDVCHKVITNENLYEFT
jgi:hypothetical protein